MKMCKLATFALVGLHKMILHLKACKSIKGNNWGTNFDLIGNIFWAGVAI